MDASPPLLRYRNREIREEDLAEIRELMKARPELGRQDLSQELCATWGWLQPNGSPAEFACRDLLLRLGERGLLELPPPRYRRPAVVRRKHPLLPPELIPVAWLPVTGRLASARLQVRPTEPQERDGVRLFIGRYHYLGWHAPIGEHVLHAAVLEGELVALLCWAAAAARVPTRERLIGWDESARRQRLHFVANNTRFLMLPWVRVPHLASQVLAASTRRLAADWQAAHGHPVHLAETFVDSARFRGTCYRAAGWRYLGQTAGRTKRGNQFLHEGSPKAVFVRELHRKALSLLRGDGPSTQSWRPSGAQHAKRSEHAGHISQGLGNPTAAEHPRSADANDDGSTTPR
jgi:hypothetical protein